MPEIHVTDEKGVEHIFPDGSTPGMIAKALNVKAPDSLAGYNPDADPYRQQQYGINAGSVLSGAVHELGNMAKGAASIFAAPQNAGEALAGPALPAYRMAKGYIQSARQGLQQGEAYAASGQPLRAGATALGAINPLSSGATASINANVDRGVPVGQVIGQGMTDAATLAAPEVAKMAAPVVSRVAQGAAEGLYRNALKPPTTAPAAVNAARVRTGLQEGLPVSAAGYEKLGTLIDDYNQKIAAEIAKDPTRPIDPNAVTTRIDSTRARFGNQVTAEPDLAAIEATRQQFLKERGARPGSPAVQPQPTGLLDAQGNPIMTPGTPATPPRPAPAQAADSAQAMKQGTYTILRKKYGEQGSAVVEAQKDLARGYKEEIATQFPELSNLNAGESKLLDLGPVLERAVNRVSNNHTIGIGGPILGTAVKAGTGSTGVAAVAGALKSIVDIPAVKSQLAIALSKGAKIPYSKALARVAAYSTQLESASPDSQGYSSDGNSNQ